MIKKPYLHNGVTKNNSHDLKTFVLQIDGNGVTLSTGPGSYKIPTLHDIPKQFNVALLEDSVNEKAVYGSKVPYPVY